MERRPEGRGVRGLGRFRVKQRSIVEMEIIGTAQS
jgi:hypothetical protein